MHACGCRWRVCTRAAWIGWYVGVDSACGVNGVNVRSVGGWVSVWARADVPCHPRSPLLWLPLPPPCLILYSSKPSAVPLSVVWHTVPPSLSWTGRRSRPRPYPVVMTQRPLPPVHFLHRAVATGVLGKPLAMMWNTRLPSISRTEGWMSRLCPCPSPGSGAIPLLDRHRRGGRGEEGTR